MMKDKDFTTWLERGGVTPKARNTRCHAVRALERNLTALGIPYADLDEAWKADRFGGLRERLRKMREDARAGGHDYRLLMPESENPHNRLPSWSSWLAQYGRFLDGEPPAAARDADRIRQYVYEHYIDPAREGGQMHVDVLVRDVNTALSLNEAWPNICQALSGQKFQELAQTSPPERIGADQSPATTFRFHLGELHISRPALEELRERFLRACPDFRTCVEPGTGPAQAEKAYKVATMERVRSALSDNPVDENLGRAVFEILKTAAKDGPFVRWQTEDSIAKKNPELLSEFYQVIGRMIRSDEPTERSLSNSFDALTSLRARGADALTYGERINILFSSLGMVRPNEVVPLKITRINEAWDFLTGQKLFVEPSVDFARDYRRFSKGFTEIFEIMRDDWQWEPQDWLDIQGFLWIANDQTAVAKTKPNSSAEAIQGQEITMPQHPVNLILYGPPGTGKTFTTAAEAVRLCGEPVPGDRSALMATYQKLMAAGRIEFITFHQSLSYEEFVEGRQPMTGARNDEAAASAGFRLETVPGVFRRIAKRAAINRSLVTVATNAIDGRQIYKMSIGRASAEEDEILFEEAIEGGFALLGWENIDWTDSRYSDANEILEACQRQGSISGPVTLQSGQVQHTDLFRNVLGIGDIIVVSRGNSLFRAIGEVTGEYEYHPRPDGRYSHRRAVRWLWIDRGGASVQEIYKSTFIQATIYRLKPERLNVAALERYMNSGQLELSGDPKDFVLVIDEINRANISKVFGELITLLESDKRLGQTNALKVRLPYSGDEFGVPSNLHILGTMNTADRSIALLDTALRRRFNFREMMPDPSVLAGVAQQCDIDLPRMLAIINERIEYLYDREHQIGHAYFTACISRADVDQVMRHKVIPLLAEYFFEDWGKIAAVLGDLERHDGEIFGGFLKRSVLSAPPGLEDGDAVPKFRWQIRSEVEGFDYQKLTGA